MTELCTGFTGECPKDLYVKNTVPCNGGKGYCFNGMCPTMKGQCATLWGRKANKADPECFRSFNTAGTLSGNCGKRGFGGGYKKCEIE